MKNLTFIALIALFFTACIKDPFNQNPSTTSAPPPTPNACPTADAALWAVRSFSTRDVAPGFPSVDIEIGLGVGIFTTNGVGNTSSSRVNVGAVSVNGENADYEGETYITKPSASNAEGVDFTSGVSWQVAGDDGFGGFTHVPTNVFPSSSAITSSKEVVKANGYTLSCSTISNADSVLFLIGDVYKIAGGNTTSYTFTATDLSGLSTGDNVAQIVPYTLSSATLGGKNICFGKEVVRQISVTIK